MLCRPRVLKIGWTSCRRQQISSIPTKFLLLKSPVLTSLGSNADGCDVAVKSRESSSSVVRATDRAKTSFDSEESGDISFKKKTAIDRVLSMGIFTLWLGLIVYATQFSPNQVPAFDTYLIRKFLFLEVDDVRINPIFTQIFFAMGIWPVIYSALLVPGQLRRQTPPLPFCLLSFGFGAFALIPYMALWTPTEKLDKQADSSPKAIEKALESKILAGGCIFSLSIIIYNIISCNSVAWAEFASLFYESRFVHITSIDFLTLTLLAPFWVANDAQERNWDAEYFVFAVIFLPLLGPALYLLLRPRKSF